MLHLCSYIDSVNRIESENRIVYIREAINNSFSLSFNRWTMYDKILPFIKTNNQIYIRLLSISHKNR